MNKGPGNIPGNLSGVVLCGGESRRMGSDKGLIKKDDLPWALHMSGKLAGYRIPVVFSINRLQLELYSTIIPSPQLIIDSVTWPGPLKGLMSVHKIFPDKDLLLLACDMLDLDDLTIMKVIDCYREETQDPPDFFVYQGIGFLQPFCGIYTARGLSGLFSRYEQGEQQDFSLQRLLKKGNTRKLPVEREEAFRNYNSI